MECLRDRCVHHPFEQLLHPSPSFEYLFSLVLRRLHLRPRGRLLSSEDDQPPLSSSSTSPLPRFPSFIINTSFHFFPGSSYLLLLFLVYLLLLVLFHLVAVSFSSS